MFSSISNKKLLFKKALQGVLFLTINIFFVLKYVPRLGWSPVACAVTYCVVTILIGLLYVYLSNSHRIDHWYRNLSVSLGLSMLAVIAVALIVIDPLSIQVDRWSATTYFLDALFKGEYPYSVHTHVSESNYPSPFPMWHYLNIPVWLCGDVGIGLILILILTIWTVFVWSGSWKTVFEMLALLALSPAYWWEVMARSDGLSNMLLVVDILLLLEHYHICVRNQFWQLGLLCGLLATTRLSAMLPLALYFLYPYVHARNMKVWIGFPSIVFGTFLLLFAPYILWYTDSWVFFHRNPFMSESGPGNRWVLISFMVLGVATALNKKSFAYFLQTTGWFIFLFMLVTQLVLIILSPSATLFGINCDISYFTLALPYCTLYLASTPLSTVETPPASLDE